jgi:polyhydroxybutyrate depolymerase
VSTLSDYSRFVRMLLGKGRFEGVRVLREESVAAMMRDQVAPMVEVRSDIEFGAASLRYGLGTWIEKLDGGGVRACDPGAFGFTPWIDLDLEVGGVFAVRDRVGRVLPQLRKVQTVVREAVTSAAVAGTQTAISLSHDGRERSYHLHVPPHEQGDNMPLLLVLHGGGGTGEQVRENTGLGEAGVRAGFAVAFADGTGATRRRLLTWNSGGIATWAADHDIDDVGFLRAVVVDVQTRAPIAAGRVFAAGHSNGAMMCHRLAREAADVFAGIAAVEGAMNFTDADSAHPIAVLIVHGTADQHVLYAGGAPKVSVGRAGERVDASVQDAIDYYLMRNKALGYPDSRVDGKVRIDTYAAGRGGEPAEAPVRVITLEGGGHAWPGAKGKTRLLADEPFPFDATAAIIEFFASLQPSPRPGMPAEPTAPR